MAKKIITMSTQSFLSLGAITLFAITSLSFNKHVLNNATNELENKVTLTAISLADALIEEIKVKGFDEVTLEFPTSSAGNLTAANLLGAEPGEVYPHFDDVDDYNGFTKVASTPHAENYTLHANIYYLEPDKPELYTTSQTFYKKLIVTVSNQYLRSPLTLSFIFTLK